MQLPSLPPALSRLQGLLAPLLLVAIAGLALLAMALNGKSQQVRQLSQQLRHSSDQRQQLEAQNQEFVQQLDGLKVENHGLEERLGSLRNQLASASTDLEHARTTASDLQAKLTDWAGERDRLRAEITSLSVQRDEAKRLAAELEQEKREAQRAAGRLRDRLAMVDRDYQQLTEELAQLKDSPPSSFSVTSVAGPASAAPAVASASSGATMLAQATVELPPIVVRKDQAGMSMPIRARVLEVNQAHHFVVIDQGTVDGVHVGMAVDLLRGATPIGRATVVRVRPQLAACDLVRSKTTGPIQVGDLALQSGP